MVLPVIAYSPGLDSFSLGVVFGADFNEHFHTESLAHLFKTAAVESSQYSIFDKAQELPEDLCEASPLDPTHCSPHHQRVLNKGKDD